MPPPVFEDEVAHISERRFYMLPDAQRSRTTKAVVDVCPACNEFFFRCSKCFGADPWDSGDPRARPVPCHGRRLIYTDGTTRGERGGLGLAWGWKKNCQQSIPLTNSVDYCYSSAESLDSPETRERLKVLAARKVRNPVVFCICHA